MHQKSKGRRPKPTTLSITFAHAPIEVVPEVTLVLAPTVQVTHSVVPVQLLAAHFAQVASSPLRPQEACSGRGSSYLAFSFCTYLCQRSMSTRPLPCRPLR